VWGDRIITVKVVLFYWDYSSLSWLGVGAHRNSEGKGVRN
jgi:hypothetical protein